MNNSDILEKAITKAINNGYKKEIFKGPFGHIGFYMDGINYYSIIFDKEFLKAIWGIETQFLSHTPTHPHLGLSCVLWEWHSKQMLICEEPLKYLEKNLDKDNWKKILEH